jgi:hypothetical protein
VRFLTLKSFKKMIPNQMIKKIEEMRSELETKTMERDRVLTDMKKIWIKTGFFETIDKIKPLLVEKEKYHFEQIISELFRVFCRPKMMYKDEPDFYIEDKSNYQRILDYPVQNRRIHLILEWLFENTHDTWLGLKKAVIINKELQYMKEDEFISYIDKVMGFRMDDIILLKSIHSYEEYLQMNKNDKKRVQTLITRDFFPNIKKNSISIDQTVKEMFEIHKKKSEEMMRLKRREDKRLEAHAFVNHQLSFPELLKLLKNYDLHDTQILQIIQDCESKIQLSLSNFS